MVPNPTRIREPPHSAGRKLDGQKPVINSAQIPSVPEVTFIDQTLWSDQAFLTCDWQRSVPLSTTDYIAVDQGNTSPRFLRATTYAFPSTNELATSCSLPLAAIAQPFADLRSGEDPICLVDLQTEGPPRCKGCQGYINCWCTWGAGGHVWKCNLCDSENTVSQTYFSPLDHQGRRFDWSQRPELQYGTIDFNVPQDYWASRPVSERHSVFPTYLNYRHQEHNATARPPGRLSTLVLIDVSSFTRRLSLVRDICEAIRTALYGRETGPCLGSKRLIGIITFDSSLHYYNLSPSLSVAKVLVVSDFEDVEPPLHDGLFVDPSHSRDLVESVLSIIPVPSHALQDQNCTFEALKATLGSFRGQGGQVLAFTSDPTLNGTSLFDKASPAAFSFQSDPWACLGKEFAENGIGVTTFCFSYHNDGLGTVGALSRLSGGDIFYFPRYSSARDFNLLERRIQTLWNVNTMFDCQIRTRVSSGLRVKDYSGSFFQPISGELLLGILDPAKAFGVRFEHTKPLNTRSNVYIQCAVLHTTLDGNRRLRLMNLALGVASLAHNVFRYSDADATASWLAKYYVDTIASQPLQRAKNSLMHQCASILLAYRRLCAAASSSSQLILPEPLKLLPVYCIGILKSGSTTGSRFYNSQRIRTMGANAIITHIYPRMYALHDSASGPNNTLSDQTKLPQMLQMTYMSMEPQGVYLAVNGEHCILWIGQRSSPHIVKDLFQVENIEAVPKLASIEPESRIFTRALTIIGEMESRMGRSIPFKIARQDMDAAELDFGDMLVEDENNDYCSYQDFLCHMHQLINTALATETDIGGRKIWYEG